MSTEIILYDYECFQIFDKYYIFSSQSQEIISVKKETFEYFQEIKDGEKVNNINKKHKFFSALLSKNYIQAHQNFEAPNFVYASNMLSLV